MTLLYISYWRAADPLTPSTVVTHLTIAAELPEVEKIILVTMEAPGQPVPVLSIPKTIHVPLYSTTTGISTLNQVLGFVRHPKQLAQLARKHGADLLLAKGVLAGALAMKASERCNVPFMVESFEPHADYMAESNEWRKGGLKYLFLRRWERLQMKKARHLFTVSNNYKTFLQDHYAVAQVDTLPCCVDVKVFQFSESLRKTFRQRLKIADDEVVGIYVGKFGGIYYDQEAYRVFAMAAKYFPRFRLIVLTPELPDKLLPSLLAAGLKHEQIDVRFVPHAEMPGWLSAADFAFATIKPAKSRKYCCPVKDGEYWASGLPILLTDGVGDDYLLLQQTHSGAIFDLEEANLVKGFATIENILRDANHRQRIHEVAVRYRSYAITRQLYARWLKPQV